MTEPPQRVVSWRRRAAEKVLGGRRAATLARVTQKAFAVTRGAIAPDGRRSKAGLGEYLGRHRGQRCVIIGNGPSLNKTDLSLLRGETTFGLNRIYMMHDKLGFRPSFLVVVNKYVVEQCRDDFMQLPGPLFTTWPNRTHLGNRANTIFLQKLAGPLFSKDVRKGIWEGATVTYVAMQLAYHMGFKDVVLVGVDHRFKDRGPAHKLVTSHGADSNHFDPNYFGAGFRWQLPDLETSEIAYRLAKEAFEARGGRIVDATVDGALDVFPKMPLADALK